MAEVLGSIPSATTNKIGPLPLYPFNHSSEITMNLSALRNVRAWTDGVEVEDEAVQQIMNVASLPIVAGPVAIMPDVHLGKGATVGSVIPTRGAIIPASVGVDIGCGMAALRTNLSADDLPDSLTRVRSAIEAVVPVGFSMHARSVSTHGDGMEGIALKDHGDELHRRYDDLRILLRVPKYNHGRVWLQAGTLGGGNHFIELCLDEEGRVWIMLHSGSRNVGKTIGETAIGMARGIALKLDRHLPDKDLAWLDEGSPEFGEYVEGLLWAQDYAAYNRALMMHAVVKALRAEFSRDVAAEALVVQCHHNYASFEEHFGEKVWITRKGAVSARAGELGIIPGSMGAKSYITRGKGNAESYCSCSHGAGRRMSRNAAKRAFSLADLVTQTEGVECRKDEGVIDEIPGAYKDIDAVIAAQADLVEVVHTLKQVMCIKG
jgi:tRNA-splicing ligase RtcB (3'-phosphate/5'-hydroxy nucleic acid ligase)